MSIPPISDTGKRRERFDVLLPGLIRFAQKGESLRQQRVHRRRAFDVAGANIVGERDSVFLNTAAIVAIDPKHEPSHPVRLTEQPDIRMSIGILNDRIEESKRAGMIRLVVTAN